jgi:hypothetical protein
VSADDLEVLANDLAIIWGAANIGSVLGLRPSQTFHMLASGQLKGAKKIGGKWCICQRALVANFFSGNSSPNHPQGAA